MLPPREVIYGLACGAGAIVMLLGLTGQATAADGRQQAPVTITVSSLLNSGTGSLRTAIKTANASVTGAVIDFSVAGVITLATALPTITRDTTIDGTSAPGYVAGGAPVVEVNCNGKAGLMFGQGSAGSQLLGLAVGAASGNGVTLVAGRITVNDDYIGLNLTGGALGNRGAGLFAGPASSHDLIGLNTSGDPGVVANVISSNGGNGITLSGSSHDTIVANRIGTNPGGTTAMANTHDGIQLTRSANWSEIGGTEYTDSTTGAVNNPTGTKGTVPPVFVTPPLGNLISGNGGNGVLITGGSRGNKLNGNFIGTTVSGNAALGNRDNGVWLDNAGANSLTGCTFVENPFVYYNVLSGNGLNGLRVTSSNSVKVQGNFFGIGANNSTAVANRLNGILVDGTSLNTQVGGVIPLGNVSAGNGKNGIEVAGKARGFVTFNTFGGLAAFGGAVPNGNDGVLITSTGGDNLARTNVLSGNRRNGIELAGNARGVTVEPDIAGLVTDGNAPLPNGGDGLLIDGSAHDNTIGGSLRSVIRQNTFSGNDGHGIVITGLAHDNRVFSSFVGPLILGVKPGGNHKGGVLIAGHAYRNTIGGTFPLPSNLISANTGTGVTLTAGTSRNRVTLNYIGLDRLGRCLPNSGRPVVDKGILNIVRDNRSTPVRGRHRTCP
jgi:parallel beta-helix repeat protein